MAWDVVILLEFYFLREHEAQTHANQGSATPHLALLNMKQGGLALILKSRAGSLQHAEIWAHERCRVTQSAVRYAISRAEAVVHHGSTEQIADLPASSGQACLSPCPGTTASALEPGQVQS